MTIKSVVDAGDKAAHDEPDDPDIIKRISHARNKRRVVRNGMVGRRHSEAEGCPSKETAKCDYIGMRGGLVAWRQNTIEPEGGGNRDQRGQQVAVDINGLIVDIGQRLKGDQEGE